MLRSTKKMWRLEQRRPINQERGSELNFSDVIFLS